MNGLRLRGLRAGNLRDLDLDLPQGRWTAVHGPSGSGKTALLFGVLEPVSRRRFRLLADPAALPGGREGWLRLLADGVEGLQPVVAAAGEIPRGRAGVEVGQALDLWPLLAAAWRRSGGRRCTRCSTEWRAPALEELLEQAGRMEAGTPVQVFSAVGGEASAALLQAGWTRIRVQGALLRLEDAAATLPSEAWLLLDRFRWAPARSERLTEALGEGLRRRRPVLWVLGEDEQTLVPAEVCPQCGAAMPQRDPEQLAGLRAAPELVVAERPWDDWCAAPLAEWLQLPLDARPAGRRRLEYLARTGLGHLTALRTLGTLSLGEARRLELVALLGQVRRDQLAIFDEPGMGLHGSERRELAALLRELVLQGNTVLTADPSREFLLAADEWLQLGPGGGPQGGKLVARGKRRSVPAEPAWEPERRREPPQEELVFRKLEARFLAIPELRMPLGRVVGMAGVSGSGKTTLLEEELVPRLREERGFAGRLPEGGVAVLLERALGHAAISTVATLSGAWSEIRKAFAEGEEARIRGLAPGDLTALPGKGACPACGGHGADRDGVLCALCAGFGLREDLLEIRLRGRALREWLSTPLERLEKRLPRAGRLRTLVRHLVDLGMGERHFGERGRRLSLGERSRIALARALAGARRGRPKLFLLDEPCLGLPFTEARRVVELLHRLAAEGHGFWVVEHHEVLLRAADWLVELGPGAGPGGGQLLFAGPPDEVVGRDTPTGRWLAERSRPPGALPRAPRRRPPVSRALPDSWRRAGRRAIEQDLLRELATRSPLVADLLASEEQEERALAPTAWPAPAPPETGLWAVLGLLGPAEELLERKGRPACMACGGAGPWADLAAAAGSLGASGAAGGEWLLSTPLALPERTRGQEGALLQAAGFRRLLRAGRSLTLEPGREPQDGDEVWLDRFDPAARDAASRLRDVEHHARLLGAGVVHARGRGAPAARAPWLYRTGSCRDCGAGTPQEPAPLAPSLAGRNLAELRDMPLGEALEHLQRHGGGGVFARASALLASSSLPLRRCAEALRAMSRLERRLARLAGMLLFPLPGVVLLHDQPLSGLPAPLARGLARAMLDGEHGAHVFTDPEGHAQPPPARAAAKKERGEFVIEPFPLELDFGEWARPEPLPPETRVREALDLTGALREHFLRTEEARLRGWTRGDLARGPGGRVCPACRGRGGQRVHPRLLLRCRFCGGSGWSRETAALEDRGLRWPDLGACPLSELRAHFADSPSLARVLEAAEALGLGPVGLDERLERLPLGARVLAPLAAWIAKGKGMGDLRLAAPAAGLNALEAAQLPSRMRGYLLGSGPPEWKDHHPALLDGPSVEL